MAKKLVITTGALMATPVLQVLVVRFVRPPVTPLMLIRWTTSVLYDNHRVPIRYHWRALEEIPEQFLAAVWVSEDPRFFDHHGFDWKEIRHALAESRAKGRRARGASTITMQCARSLFLWQRRSWVRKGLEAYYTALMEHVLSKRRILELYVNVIELGDGVYGLEAAAQHYYGVPAERLTIAQCSALAVILPYPRVWDPREPADLMLARQKLLQRKVSQAPSVFERLRGRTGPWTLTDRPDHDDWGPLWSDT